METSSNKRIDFGTLVAKEKKAYLRDVILTDTDFSEFYSILNDIELIYLSINHSLTPTMIDSLFDKALDNININLLKNPNCPTHRIDWFLKLNDKIYNIALAHNANMSKTQFYRLFEYMDLDVNISLSYNQNTPIEIIQELVLLHNKFINEALCSNPNTPLEVLQNFLYDGSMKSSLSNNQAFNEYVKHIKNHSNNQL